MVNKYKSNEKYFEAIDKKEAFEEAKKKVEKEIISAVENMKPVAQLQRRKEAIIKQIESINERLVKTDEYKQKEEQKKMGKRDIQSKEKMTEEKKREEKKQEKKQREEKKEERKEKKGVMAAIAKQAIALGEKLKRGQHRQSETQEVKSLRGQIAALGKKIKKSKSEDEKMKLEAEQSKLKAKIILLKEDEGKKTETKTESKTETKTEEPKIQALREMARTDQQSILESYREPRVSEEKKKESKEKKPKVPPPPESSIKESQQESQRKSKEMSQETKDAIYKRITGREREPKVTPPPESSIKESQQEAKESKTPPPIPPPPQESTRKKKEDRSEQLRIKREEKKAEEKIREITRRQQRQRQIIKEKEKKEPKSSLDIFEEDIGGITRAELREYGKRRERTMKTTKRIRMQEEKLEQPRTKRQEELISLNQRIEDMSEYGLEDPLDEYIRVSRHERGERKRQDINNEFIDERPLPIRNVDTTNKTASQIEQEEEQKHFDKQLESQIWADKYLTPDDYDVKHNSYGQENLGNIERKLMSNIEIYEREIINETIQLAKKRHEAIRRGDIDPEQEFKIGDYNEMFNYTDEQKQQRRERHLNVIQDFMRENNISTSSLQGRNLSEIGDRGLRHIAESIGIGEDSYNRYEGLLDVYGVAREMGITQKILDRPEIKETYVGRALRSLDQEAFEKGGKLTNISQKFGNILEAMTVPVKIMTGTSDLSDIRRLWEGFKGGRDIAQGVGKVIKGSPDEKDPERTPREYEPYDDSEILKQLANIREEIGGVKPKGLSYPEEKEITPYYFPRPDQYYDATQLIKNSVTNYLNDINMFGGSYTSENLNDI